MTILELMSAWGVGRPAAVVPQARPETPISDAMEATAGMLMECSEAIRDYEPLSIEMVRQHGMRIMRAHGEYTSALGDLMAALSR